MLKNGLEELAQDYATVVRSNTEYDFVYFEKYYPHLKSFFVQARVKPSAILPKELNVDLTLTEKIHRTSVLSPLSDYHVAEESMIINLFKYQDYSDNELFEIATSFIQSEMPKVAFMAVEIIINRAVNDRTFLKASYLKLTCLLLLGDNRAAVDCALGAIDRARTKDDILSFLYGEAEAYIRLGLIKDAKRVLKEIISIDSDYRLTRERLEKLDEI
jgi:tetratricopeptide (TPR) repeat protein